jgi:hypothetical protein
MGTAQKLAERKLDRMRLGQSACDIHPLLSDPEIRVALVPLTEAEYLVGLESAIKMNVPETIMGNQARDRRLQEETLLRAIREVDDLTQQTFETLEQLNELLDHSDISYLMDMYFEMIAESSPSIDGLSETDIEDVKKVLKEMDWNVLSGRQWYALKRFLSTLGQEQLLAKSLGSTSISKLTGQSGLSEPTPETVEQS